MAQLRLAKKMDTDLFPGCLSVVDNTPPIAQCQEAQVDEVAGAITDTMYTIDDVGAFVGLDLAGKKVTVTAPVGEAGTFGIVSNTDDQILTDNQFGATDPATAYTCHDVGQAYLTRNESSFQRFVENLGNAHTTIGGQLYTDVATGPLANACTDTYSPD